MIAGYGADAVRAYVLFMGPVDKEKMWNEDGLAGIYKFLNRLWRIVCDLKCAAGDKTLFDPTADATNAHDKAEKLRRERHRVAEKVTVDFERNNFNTALAAIMELSNAASDYLHRVSADNRAANAEEGAFAVEVAEVLVKLIAPIAPHFAEELWSAVLGRNVVGDKVVTIQEIPERVNGELCFSTELNGLVLRGRREGDSFHRYGGGRKSLGDYLTDTKVPLRVRDRLVVLARDNDVLAVVGVEIADSVKVTQSSRKIYKITEEKYEE
jgi:tRNA(Ile)-lysidine synthetase-like protein